MSNLLLFLQIPIKCTMIFTRPTKFNAPCEHNNRFINEHMNEFYLKRGKRMKDFIL